MCRFVQIYAAIKSLLFCSRYVIINCLPPFRLNANMFGFPCRSGDSQESGAIMCKVKTGALVQTDTDLQNLITSIILRQTKPFTKETIEEQLLSKLEGSVFSTENKKREQALKTCKRTLKFMMLSSSIRSMGIDDQHYRLVLSFPSYNPAMMNMD